MDLSQMNANATRRKITYVRRHRKQQIRKLCHGQGRPTTMDPTRVSYKACAKVLHTPELLEKILLQLPPKQVLVAQRVSKFWKASIEESPKIQKGCWLRPTSKDIVSHTLQDERFRSEHRQDGAWRTAEDESEGVFTLPCWNPLPPGDYAWSHEAFEGFRRRDDSVHLPSWKNMLIMHPPCQVITYRCRKDGIPRTIKNEAGITFKDVFTELQRHRHPRSKERAIREGPKHKRRTKWKTWHFEFEGVGLQMGHMIGMRLDTVEDMFERLKEKRLRRCMKRESEGRFESHVGSL